MPPGTRTTRQMPPRMMTGQPIKVCSLSTTPRSGLRKDRALTITKKKKKTEPEPEQALGGRARGVDKGGAQAVEEDRRRERAVQVGEEVDDVEPALNQMSQIIGGESHGFGRALLAVGNQVANDGQAPDQGQIEQTEIAVDGPHERRARCGRRAVPASSGSSARRPSRPESRDRDPSRPLRRSRRPAGRRSGPSRSWRTRSASCRRWSRSSRASIAPFAMLELAPQRHQAMAVARLGLLGLQRLEQDDVAIQQSRHAADQAIAEPQAG